MSEKKIIFISIVIAVIFIIMFLLPNIVIIPSEEAQHGTVINIIAFFDNINASEVKRINYTYLKDELLGYNFSFHHKEDNYSLSYLAEDLTRNNTYGLGVGIEVYLNKTTNKAWLLATNWCGVPEKYLEREKQYLIEKVNIFTQVCNINIDWNDATWTVNYGDD